MYICKYVNSNQPRQKERTQCMYTTNHNKKGEGMEGGSRVRTGRVACSFSDLSQFHFIPTFSSLIHIANVVIEAKVQRHGRPRAQSPTGGAAAAATASEGAATAQQRQVWQKNSSQEQSSAAITPGWGIEGPLRRPEAQQTQGRRQGGPWALAKVIASDALHSYDVCCLKFFLHPILWTQGRGLASFGGGGAPPKRHTSKMAKPKSGPKRKFMHFGGQFWRVRGTEGDRRPKLG